MTLFSGLGALIPTAAIDVVAVFSQEPVEGASPTIFQTAKSLVTGDGIAQEGQIIQGARPMKALIKEDAEYYKHLLENSSEITDHRIILPVEIEITMVITGEEFRDIYQEIKQLFLDGTALVIQTKTDTYSNQIIQGMPHDETPEVFDGIVLTFFTSELQIAASIVEFSPADETDASTVDRGEQLPKEATAGKSSVALDLFNKAKEFF